MGLSSLNFVSVKLSTTLSTAAAVNANLGWLHVAANLTQQVPSLPGTGPRFFNNIVLADTTGSGCSFFLDDVQLAQ